MTSCDECSYLVPDRRVQGDDGPVGDCTAFYCSRLDPSYEGCDCGIPEASPFYVLFTEALAAAARHGECPAFGTHDGIPEP